VTTERYNFLRQVMADYFIPFHIPTYLKRSTIVSLIKLGTTDAFHSYKLILGCDFSNTKKYVRNSYFQLRHTRSS